MSMEKQLAKSDKNINELADKRDALQSKLDVATTEKADISAKSAADKATIAELKNQIKTLSGNKKA